MKLLLSAFAIAIIAASLYADYKWRKWIAVRRQEREHPDSTTHG